MGGKVVLPRLKKRKKRTDAGPSPKKEEERCVYNLASEKKESGNPSGD